MATDHSEKRSEPRLPIKAGTIIEVMKNGEAMRGTTIDMSASGVLLCFAEAVELFPGDQVTCEFMVDHEPDQPLPYWGVGKVLRADGCHVAIALTAIGLTPVAPSTVA
jgi:c-di-GMP-binding flagellar brake protein YcgR